MHCGCLFFFLFFLLLPPLPFLHPPPLLSLFPLPSFFPFLIRHPLLLPFLSPPSSSSLFFLSSLLCSALPFLRSQRSESARWCLCQRAATAGLHPAEDRRASSQRGPAVRHFPNSAGDPPHLPPHLPPPRPSTPKALSSFLTVNAANYGSPTLTPLQSPPHSPALRFPLAFHHPSQSLSTWVSHIIHPLKEKKKKNNNSVCELKQQQLSLFI